MVLFFGGFGRLDFEAESFDEFGVVIFLHIFDVVVLDDSFEHFKLGRVEISLLFGVFYFVCQRTYIFINAFFIHFNVLFGFPLSRYREADSHSKKDDAYYFFVGSII